MNFTQIGVPVIFYNCLLTVNNSLLNSPQQPATSSQGFAKVKLHISLLNDSDIYFFNK